MIDQHDKINWVNFWMLIRFGLLGNWVHYRRISVSKEFPDPMIKRDVIRYRIHSDICKLFK